jgi:CheY-like chemotaxis protein
MPFEDAHNDELPIMLVVDDDEVSLAVICLLLEADGYRVLRARGGEQALKEAAGLPPGSEPAVVLADLQMPGLCGPELGLALRTLLPRTVLIAMSATADPAEGYDGFVGKPLDLAELRGHIVQIDGAEAESAPDEMASDDIPILDERIFHKLQRMMPTAALADIYRVCIADTRKRAAAMVEQAKPGGFDQQRVRQSAHAIKGGAGMIGAAKLAAAAATIELDGYPEDEIPGLTRKLLDICNQLQSILVTKVKGY